VLHRLRRKLKISRYGLEEMQLPGAASAREQEVTALVDLQEAPSKFQDLEVLRQLSPRHHRYRRARKELRASAAVRRKRLMRTFKSRRSALLRVSGQ
jgi:hypothetical protein